MREQYLETAKLLVQIAPTIFADRRFALKGGTAINLFVRDMPRLSVDLDLVFLDHRKNRVESIAEIGAAFDAIASKLRHRGYKVDFAPPAASQAEEHKMFVQSGSIRVKVEVNPVMRGTLHPPVNRPLSAAAQKRLGLELELPIVSLSDLYAGKLVAALDRQHPRDLFDVKLLFESDGLTAEMRRAFVVYLACHNRPVHEVLFPKRKDITLDYNSAFFGMTDSQVTLEQICEVRERLCSDLPNQLDKAERAFLLSLVSNEPIEEILGFVNLNELPAIRWKKQNIAHLAARNPQKLAQQHQALLAAFTALETRDGQSSTPNP